MTDKLQYTYYNELGDQSHDGHEKTEKVYFKSNRNKQEIHNLNSMVTKTFGNYRSAVASYYENASVPQSMILKMKEFDWYDDNWFGEGDLEDDERSVSYWDDSFMELWFQLMRYHDRGFRWKHIQDPVEDSGLGGGYGLFY
jgi:hypothetical protein